jgi:hypothetical protein
MTKKTVKISNRIHKLSMDIVEKEPLFYLQFEVKGHKNLELVENKKFDPRK